MRIKHFAGYGSVSAKKIKDGSHTLHIRVTGNHEWGLVRENLYDLYHWLIRRFDKRFPSVSEWEKLYPYVEVVQGYDHDTREETCDYLFDY